MRSSSALALSLVFSCGVFACGSTGDLPDSTGGKSSSTGGVAGGGVGGAHSGGIATAGNATSGSSTGGVSGGNTFGGNPTGGNATGGVGRGGNPNAGGFGTGGRAAGGNTSTGGVSAGGTTGASGSGGTGTPPGSPDCSTALPTSGETMHGSNGSGGAGNLGWELWSNTGKGQMTTYSTPAFVATWNDAGDYLGRLGYEWGGFQGSPVSHDKRGTITAQFVSKRNGTGGQYSYIGMYGWTTNPCVEWYIVEDSYNTMPVNPGNTTKKDDIKMLDGSDYVVYTRNTTGTGGSRCSNVNSWIQYYSIRKTARACGVISLSEHFKAWQTRGMDMTGELLEAKILVEVGGGNGNVQFPVANVVVQ